MVFGKVINRYYKKYWYYFVLGILGLVLVDYAQLCIPEIMGQLVRDLTLHGQMTLEMVMKPVFSILIIGVLIFVGRFVWRLTILKVGFKVEADLREEMFIHAEKLSVNYYQEQKVGVLMALFTNDLETIQNVVSDGTIFTVDAFFLGTLSLIKMMKSNWKLGLIATIPLFVLAACGNIVGKAMSKKHEDRQEAYEKLSDFSQESFTGLSVVKAFVKETHELRAFAKINKINKKANIEFVRYGVLLDILIDVLVYSIIVLILAIGGYYVIYNQDGFDAGNITEFVGYFNTIVWPMLALAQIINLRSRGKTSLNRIDKLLSSPLEINDDKAQDVASIKGKIEFRNFSFCYPRNKEATLKNITLTINQGEIIGVVGKIGTGKTTLIQALLHLYNVNQGQVFIDDIDVMNIPLNVLRENIGYVPQDQFLFSCSLAENISFADEKATQATIEKAAQFASIDENIQGFSKGYETISGERGVTLSGGQKQRISIARAIIKSPNILILDDAVSAVDMKTEEIIMNNIQKERQNKTTIIVASRVSTIRKADRIIVLNDGRLEAFASHEQLLKECSLYQHMVELQELEKELEGDTWQK